MTKKQILWEVLKAAALGVLTGGATMAEIRGTDGSIPSQRKTKEGAEQENASFKGAFALEASAQGGKFFLSLGFRNEIITVLWGIYFLVYCIGIGLVFYHWGWKPALFFPIMAVISSGLQRLTELVRNPTD